MAPLTWRNVDAPDNSSVSQMFARAGGAIQGAGENIAGLGQDIRARQINETSNEALMNMSRINSLQGWDQAMAEGGALSGLDPRNLNQAAMQALMGRRSDLLADEMKTQQMKLAMARAAGGGSGGGGGGGRGGAGGTAATQKLASAQGQILLNSMLSEASVMRAKGDPESLAMADRLEEEASQLAFQHGHVDSATNIAQTRAANQISNIQKERAGTLANALHTEMLNTPNEDHPAMAARWAGDDPEKFAVAKDVIEGKGGPIGSAGPATAQGYTSGGSRSSGSGGGSGSAGGGSAGQTAITSGAYVNKEMDLLNAQAAPNAQQRAQLDNPESFASDLVIGNLNPEEEAPPEQDIRQYLRLAAAGGVTPDRMNMLGASPRNQSRLMDPSMNFSLESRMAGQTQGVAPTVAAAGNIQLPEQFRQAMRSSTSSPATLQQYAMMGLNPDLATRDPETAAAAERVNPGEYDNWKAAQDDPGTRKAFLAEVDNLTGIETSQVARILDLGKVHTRSIKDADPYISFDETRDLYSDKDMISVAQDMASKLGYSDARVAQQELNQFMKEMNISDYRLAASAMLHSRHSRPYELLPSKGVIRDAIASAANAITGTSEFFDKRGAAELVATMSTREGVEAMQVRRQNMQKVEGEFKKREEAWERALRRYSEVYGRGGSNPDLEKEALAAAKEILRFNVSDEADKYGLDHRKRAPRPTQKAGNPGRQEAASSPGSRIRQVVGRPYQQETDLLSNTRRFIDDGDQEGSMTPAEALQWRMRQINDARQ